MIFSGVKVSENIIRFDSVSNVESDVKNIVDNILDNIVEITSESAVHSYFKCMGINEKCMIDTIYDKHSKFLSIHFRNASQRRFLDSITMRKLQTPFAISINGELIGTSGRRLYVSANVA